MKQIWKKVLIVMGLGLCPILAYSSFNTVMAQSQTTPPYGVDRWDPGWTERGMWGPDMMDQGQLQRMARHWTFIHGGLPFEYRGLWSPLAETPDVVQAGRSLYQQKCAECHGAQGMGDGEAAKALNPSPALLAYMIQRPISVDEYLMWSISDGGKELGTDMPAFKDNLSRDEIWTIIAFMRAGFPQTAAE